MKKEKIEIFKILRYICLSVILIFGLMTIVGTGGGGSGSKTPIDDDPIVDEPTLPVAGEWRGISGFGEIELVVNSDRTGIEKIGLYFDDFTCGIATFTDFTLEVSGFVWDISNRQFTAQLDLGTNADTIYIVGTFDDSGTYVSGTYEANINGTICDGDWDASPGWTPPDDVPTPPVAGEWSGLSGFGEIELVVNSDRTGLESIALIFNDFPCAGFIFNGTTTVTGSWDISNRQFTAQLDLGTNADTIYIVGTFDDSGTYVSGTYEVDVEGTICDGIWDASPV